MSEEKKIQRGGVTPEQEGTLEGVTGGWDAGDEWRYANRVIDCNRCSKQNTDACPYSNDMEAYYNSTETCKAR